MQRVEAICCEKFRRPCRESLRIYSRPRAYMESRRTPDDPVVSSSGLRWKPQLRTTLMDVEQTYRF
jgi:hypothetical protein